jgi:DNA-binding CsgD family transcriptional regulator
MRSAIRQSASRADRDSAHAALATVLEGEGDRALWHRAVCSAVPDESIACALENVASRAHRSGAVIAAVTALEHAARLSEDSYRQVERLLRAAEFAVELGRNDAVVRLLGQAEPLEPSPRQRMRMAWIQGSFDDGMRDASAGILTMADLAEAVATDGDVDLAVRVLWGAARRSFWRESGADARRRIVTVAEGLPIDELDPRLLAILAYAAPIERGAAVISRLRHWAAHPSGNAQEARLLGTASVLVGTFDLAEALSAASISGLREQGRLGMLAQALGAQAWSAARLSDLEVAIPVAEEAARLADETAQPFMYGIAKGTEAMVAALRGEHERVRTLTAEAERIGLAAGARPILATVQIARGLSALGEGSFAEAYDHLRRMHDPADPSYQLALSCYTLGDLADAAAHSGRSDQLGDIMRDLEAVGRKTPSPGLHTGLRYARAVLAPDDQAEALFLSAFAEDLDRWPFVRARTQLAYGEWLRRQRRVTESRSPLRAARETFDALGALPWSRRAREEIRATGERSSRPPSEARDKLTPQELQIAQLAAAGLTNKEIGERLYLSHRTIGAHLYRIFPKLDITARFELSTALAMPA